MAYDVNVYEEIKNNVLCRLYYKSIFGGQYIKVYAPFNKSVHYIKSIDEIHEICEPLFEKGYFEGHHQEVFTDKITTAVFARSVVYWLSRAGMTDRHTDRAFKINTINDYLLPLLSECKCSYRTKERFLIQFDHYLSGKITLRQLLMYFSLRIIRIRKKLTLTKVKIG